MKDFYKENKRYLKLKKRLYEEKQFNLLEEIVKVIGEARLEVIESMSS